MVHAMLQPLRRRSEEAKPQTVPWAKHKSIYIYAWKLCVALYEALEVSEPAESALRLGDLHRMVRRPCLDFYERALELRHPEAQVQLGVYLAARDPERASKVVAGLENPRAEKIRLRLEQQSPEQEVQPKEPEVHHEAEPQVEHTLESAGPTASPWDLPPTAEDLE